MNIRPNLIDEIVEKQIPAKVIGLLDNETNQSILAHLLKAEGYNREEIQLIFEHLYVLKLEELFAPMTEEVEQQLFLFTKSDEEKEEYGIYDENNQVVFSFDCYVFEKWTGFWLKEIVASIWETNWETRSKTFKTNLYLVIDRELTDDYWTSMCYENEDTYQWEFNHSSSAFIGFEGKQPNYDEILKSRKNLFENYKSAMKKYLTDLVKQKSSIYYISHLLYVEI